jgi:predicted permease
MLAILSVVMPAFIIMATGFYLGKKNNPDLTFTADLGITIFIPCLLFYSIVTTDISLLELAKIVFYGLTATLTVAFCAFLLLKHLFRWDERKINSFLLISCFPNTGNFGLPVALFAFGEIGMAVMLIYTIAQTILVNTLGIYLACKNNYSMHDSIENVLKMPGISAIAVSIFIKALGISLPEIILRPLYLMAQAVVPVLLICVGVQLSRISPSDIKKLFLPSFIGRFIFYPIIAISIIPLFFDFFSLTAKTLMIAAFLPTSAASNTFTLKFDPQNDMVPTGTLITNALCILVLTVVLKFLM